MLELLRWALEGRRELAAGLVLALVSIGFLIAAWREARPLVRAWRHKRRDEVIERLTMQRDAARARARELELELRMIREDNPSNREEGSETRPRGVAEGRPIA